MLEALLHAPIACATSWGDDPTAELFAEERALVANAIPERQREFATGRACVRRALAVLGVQPQAIMRGATREPLWPHNVVGSITHCAGYRAAAVAHRDYAASIGIDAEPHERLPQRLLGRIALMERVWLAEAPGGVHWGRLIFSAKESVYKAWFPLAGRWLGFEDVAVTFDVTKETFTAHFLVTTSWPIPPYLTGRYKIANGLVVTAVVVLNKCK